MVQVPDAIRPYTRALQKFHFWILVAVAPLVLLPMLFLARAGMSSQIESQRNKIKSSLESVEAIFRQAPHANEKWSQQIGARAGEINDETFQVWRRLWESQKPLRSWPESLGSDFVKSASSLKVNGVLKRSLLERYQNGIRPIVRQLPARMGADELMSDASSEDGMRGPRVQPLERGLEEAPPSLLQWSGEDQQQLFDSFNWEEPPSTLQVVMAQEELWMYGVLCDVIRKVNSIPVAADPKAVITPANIAMPFIAELKVGYPAAEDDPGGVAAQRILRIKPAGSSAFGDDMGFAESMPDSMMESEGGMQGRPPHPRFTSVGAGGRGSAMAMMPETFEGEFTDSAAEASPDDALKNWVYVDLDGKPLMGADLADNPSTQMLRLMPFVLRATIDQRALDALLVELASAPVLIDTRQLRVNADESAVGDFAGRGSSRSGFPGASRPRRGRPSRMGDAPGMGGVGGDRARLHDADVELRGTLAIVMRPDAALLQVSSGSNQANEERSE